MRTVRVRVEERVPGKQGLKRHPSTFSTLPSTVEERVPGKQGLKPEDVTFEDAFHPKSKSEFQENKD